MYCIRITSTYLSVFRSHFANASFLHLFMLCKFLGKMVECLDTYKYFFNFNAQLRNICEIN